VIAEILAGPVVWGGFGWLADRWLGTFPWLFVIGVMGGFVGGLYLVWLRLGRLRSADEAKRTSKEGEHVGGTSQADDRPQGRPGPGG
jgi:F0F1-type ATP synthase assembly protein I